MGVKELSGEGYFDFLVVGEQRGSKGRVKVSDLL